MDADKMPKDQSNVHRFNRGGLNRPPYYKKSKSCSNCKTTNLHYNRYCIQCGHNIQQFDSIYCYSCQQRQSSYNRFCWACGELTTPLGQKPVYAAPRIPIKTTTPPTTNTPNKTLPEATPGTSGQEEAEEVFSETVQDWADMS